MRKSLIALFFLATLFLRGANPYVETAAVTSAWTTICEMPTWNYSSIHFGIKNTGLTNPFTDCQVETWVGPNADDWVVISSSWTACKSLAPGVLTDWFSSGITYPTKMRVQVKSALGTSAYCRQYGK